MAKKISKHSRAARRGLVNEDFDEAKDLANLPKPETNDVKKSIIRTTIKNETLLNKKMEYQKVKKSNKKKTNSLKFKVERSTKLEGVLSSKIEQSITRAKYVQNQRKSGWDQINKSIVIKNDLVEPVGKPIEETVERLEKEAEEAYVQQFFEDDSKHKDVSPSISAPVNSFALLDEAEA